MVELQDIFRQYGAEYVKQHPLSVIQEKAMRAILSCRTSALGAHIDRCDECGFEQISYNSCRNRHCPKCQALAKEQWIDKQQASLLNARYFHAVFTVPDDLHPLFYQNQKLMYGLLFKAASETILELCVGRKHLGAVPGITAVLHTWGQNLHYHKDHNRMKTMSLNAHEFIRRFLMHVLPAGFRKIRHYGLFASRDKSKRLALCRRLTRTRLKLQEALPAAEKLAALLGKDWNLCPCCGVGHLCRDPPAA